MSRILTALAIALVLSLLANLTLWRAWLEGRDQVTAAGERAGQAEQAARSCSASVARLEDAARDRAREALRTLELARGQALTHQQAAQRILAAPPAVQGDACASAGAAIDAWLQGRPQK